jgi:serine phosphatase RsbU (regulator of sigma subunit)
MLKNENSLSILNKSRNTSNNDKDDETDTNHKKETIITNTSKILSNNSKERSAIYKNIKGFAFSLGSRILKNNAHEHTLIRSLFKRKSSKKKIKSTVKKEKIPEEVLHSKTNSFQRKVSKEKLSSSSKLGQYYNARKGSVNSIKSVRSLFKEDESFKEVIDIYNKYDDKIEPKIIKKLKEVEKCSILKYGIKPSTEEI